MIISFYSTRLLCCPSCLILTILIPGISGKFVSVLSFSGNNAYPIFWCYCMRQATRAAVGLVGEGCSSSVFFQCEDQKVELLYDILRQIVNNFSQKFPQTISLSLHSSTSYLGFFISDSHANILKEIAVAFSSEASALAGRINIGGKMGGSSHKCLDMTLKPTPVSPQQPSRCFTASFLLQIQK